MAPYGKWLLCESKNIVFCRNSADDSRILQEFQLDFSRNKFWSEKQTTLAIMHYPYWWRANSNVPDNCRKYFGRIHITKSQSSCTTPSTNNIQNHKCPIIFSAKWMKNSFVLDILAKILWVTCKNYFGKYVSNLVTKYVNMYVLWN